MGLPLSKYVWFDGKFVTLDKAKVPITTHAIHYGTSVFEGVRAYWNGKNLFIFRLNEHIKRFRRSGQFYNISLNFSDEIINNAIIGICKKNKIKKSCYIRPFYFIGDYGINLHVTEKAPTNVAIFIFPFGDLFNKNGISAGVVSWRKFSDMSTPPQAKMGGNYLNSIIATQEAKRNGFDEAILLDHSGNVSEAPGENIFIVREDKLITPPLSSSALNGITRDAIIKIACDLDIDVIETEIARSELMISDEIFLTGTAAEITPIISMDGKKIANGKPGEITMKLMKKYTEIVMNKNQDYSHWLTEVY
ncbi:branched-chain amino acid aminotransferase [Candidatus Nitrosarchaeum limnium SFB1]|jgi:branched-chain amino acid aminotransferase|uniref:Branched-chain-amino-acid aminotransferase n=1 Tax=Candidatus Nitrosarchaeum limnium SFB1 TaxID=886738 RepID=F3KKY2_9ARCH|nr:branched-chain amino acid aminotransferase [Candidatus Nitrosarchaeum limnium SFB1]